MVVRFYLYFMTVLLLNLDSVHFLFILALHVKITNVVVRMGFLTMNVFNVLFFEHHLFIVDVKAIKPGNQPFAMINIRTPSSILSPPSIVHLFSYPQLSSKLTPTLQPSPTLVTLLYPPPPLSSIHLHWFYDQLHSELFNAYHNTELVCADAWNSRWSESKHKSDYGKFVLSAGKFYGDAEKDKGEWKWATQRCGSCLVNISSKWRSLDYLTVVSSDGSSMNEDLGEPHIWFPKFSSFSYKIKSLYYTSAIRIKIIGINEKARWIVGMDLYQILMITFSKNTTIVR